MYEGKQVSSQAARFRSHNTLGGDGSYGSVNGVAAGLENPTTCLSGEAMRSYDCAALQETLRSGRKRLSASRTARTTDLVSSSSAKADPMRIRSDDSVTSTT